MKTLPVGLQLYTVRDEMAKNVPETLKAVKEMGYCTASSQGRMYSKRAAARYLCCGGNLFLRYAD